MGFTDPKLKIEVTADANKAKAEINEVDGLLGKIGSGNGLAALAGPAGVAAGAIASIGTAAIGVTSALFGLASQAAE
jgi:hypothetical protein